MVSPPTGGEGNLGQPGSKHAAWKWTMLFQRSRNRKGAAKATPVFALEAPDTDDQRGARLCALAQRARDELLPWLSTPCVPARPGLRLGGSQADPGALLQVHPHVYSGVHGARPARRRRGAPAFGEVGHPQVSTCGRCVGTGRGLTKKNSTGRMSLEQEQAWFRESEEIIEHSE